MSQQLVSRDASGKIRDVNDNNGYPVQLTGSKVSLASATYDQALNVAAGNSTTITITPPLGELWRIKDLYLDTPAPVGATAGSHSIEVRTGANDSRNDVIYLSSNYGDVLTVHMNFIKTATSTNGKLPTTEQAQQMAILNIVATNAEPLYLLYTNFTTGGTQSGVFEIRMVREVEHIV